MVSAIASGIGVVTYFPSPYQIELFDEVERVRPGAVVAYYLHRTHRSRSWAVRVPRHRAIFVDDDAAVFEHAARDLRATGLVVFNYYVDRAVSDLLKTRVASGGPWCFWGERPGYRYPRLGRLLRRWKLHALHTSRQPIWGVGEWALDAYRKEFGINRTYVNLPYFSNLTRFQLNETMQSNSDLTFLYSGTLSYRKGVDVLARAFCRLAQTEPSVRLKIMGSGDLGERVKTTLAPCRAQVEWIGFKDWNELPGIYATADILCAPSRYDGWGLVVPEALAAGLPVIGTDRTGAALDLIQPGLNGWLASAGDEDSLYEAMRSAAKLTEQERQVMARRARNSVAHHTLANGARRFLEAADAASR